MQAVGVVLQALVPDLLRLMEVQTPTLRRCPDPKALP
jgi:hypothetical protein